MLYTPSELAKQVGFNVRQVYRVYLPLGCPHTRDEKNRIWINGRDFGKWYLSAFPKRSLSSTQTFCRTCREAVSIENPEHHSKGEIDYLTSNCPKCNRKIARIISNRRGKNDYQP